MECTQGLGRTAIVQSSEPEIRRERTHKPPEALRSSRFIEPNPKNVGASKPHSQPKGPIRPISFQKH